MQKCNNNKSTLRVAVENVLNSTAKGMMVMFILSILTFIVGCAKEQLTPAAAPEKLVDKIEVIKNHYSSSTRTLAVSATPVDTMAKSNVNFAHTAVMQYSDDGGYIYDLDDLNPTAYAYITQSKGRIDVASEALVRPHLQKQQLISRVPFFDGINKGEDFHVQFTYDDGNVDDVYYGWKAMTLVSGTDTLATPHIEFGALALDTIYVATYGEQTELDKPHKLDTQYSLSFTTKGVSGRETTSSVVMRPWRIKSVTDDPLVLTGNVTYSGKYVGCPINEYQLVQTVPTNKGTLTIPASVPVKVTITGPEQREQPSLDSLFNAKSVGKTKEIPFSETVNEDGFTMVTKNGTHSSKNTGLENKTSIESTINYTITYPKKFQNQYGSFDIDSLTMTFEEAGFTLKSVSQDADNHVWETTNMVIPKIGTCQMDVVDAIVRIIVAKEKQAVPVDSTYTTSGDDDEYIINKTIIWSDGSKTSSKYTYDGRHSAKATNFGEKITSSLSWNADALKANGSNSESEKKDFTPTTRFEVVYTTTNFKSDATNGVESGVFAFSETHPVVTFVDGDKKITFDERKVILSGKGAQPAANYTIVTRDGVSYKGYDYNMYAGVIFDGEAEVDVMSQGLLLIVADEAGEPRYTYEQTWSGNTTTVKATKTTPHSFGDDEVETSTASYTVSMSDLQDGRIDADNAIFGVSSSITSEKNLEELKQGKITIKPRQRDFNYEVSNGAVKRNMTNTVIDAVFVFEDGSERFEFDATLSVDHDETYGTPTTDGIYQVTPVTTVVTAKASGGINAPTLTVKGVTSIYIKQNKNYTTEESWSGNTFTAKVIKTQGSETKTFTKSFNVSMTELTTVRVDASDNNFVIKDMNFDEKVTEDNSDPNWLVKSRDLGVLLTASNGQVSKTMENKVHDAIIVFSDGEYTHTFNAQLTITKAENKGTKATDGDYEVTPINVTLTAKGAGTNAPNLTTTGVFNIYVEAKKEVTYQVIKTFDAAIDGDAYYSVTVNRLLNGKVEKTWSYYLAGISYGTFKPNVTSQVVSEYKVARHNDTIDDMPDLSRTETLGKGECVANVTAKQYHFRAFFNAPVDADGNTEREISSHINVWSTDLVFTDPDNGHVEHIPFIGKAISIKSTVEDKTYVRQINITCNDDVVEEQKGTVALRLPE